jgi:hypothetical protein
LALAALYSASAALYYGGGAYPAGFGLLQQDAPAPAHRAAAAPAPALAPAPAADVEASRKRLAAIAERRRVREAQAQYARELAARRLLELQGEAGGVPANLPPGYPYHNQQRQQQ